MVIFLTAAVAITAIRAAARAGQLYQGPQAPEGALGLSGGLSFLAASLAAACVVTSGRAKQSSNESVISRGFKIFVES